MPANGAWKDCSFRHTELHTTTTCSESMKLSGLCCGQLMYVPLSNVSHPLSVCPMFVHRCTLIVPFSPPLSIPLPTSGFVPKCNGKLSLFVSTSPHLTTYYVSPTHTCAYYFFVQSRHFVLTHLTLSVVLCTQQTCRFIYISSFHTLPSLGIIVIILLYHHTPVQNFNWVSKN